MKKDIISKKVIKNIIKDIARLILNINITNISFEDKELQRIEKREADIVVSCDIDGKRSLLHIEIQNNNQKQIPLRMLRYYTDIQLAFPSLPVYQYLIYIGKDKISMNSFIKTSKLSYEYDIIDMQTIDCESFLKQDTPEALVLSILCDFKGRDEKEIISYIIKRLREISDSDKTYEEYMLSLEILSQNRDLKERIEEIEMLLREVDIEKLPSFEVGIKKGIEKGIEKGIKKGKEEGKREEQLAIARSMLLNNLDEELIQKITKLSKNEIEKLKQN